MVAVHQFMYQIMQTAYVPSSTTIGQEFIRALVSANTHQPASLQLSSERRGQLDFHYRPDHVQWSVNSQQVAGRSLKEESGEALCSFG